LELSSTGGTRVVPADAFFVAPGQTVRQPHELLTRILIPASIGTNAYVRFTNRLAMDLAVVGVAVHLELREGHCVAARIALSAAAPTPVLAPAAAQALIGTTLDPTSIQNAAALVLEAATPIDDGRGTRTHRRALLPVLAKRAISLALSRAQQRGPS
jgi:carbon-monoxide dehydrogenase medium subunit